MASLIYILVFFAQGVFGNPGDVGVPDQELNAGSVTTVMNVVFMIAGAIAVISTIIAGILFTTSSGDPGKAAKARNGILYSVIGLIAVSLAFGITNFVLQRVGVAAG